MWQSDSPFKRHRFLWLVERWRIFAASAIVLLVVMFAGIYFRNVFEQEVVKIVNREINRLQRRHNVVVRYQSIDFNFRDVGFSEVKIGQPSWLEIDRVSVRISLNPFSDFLRPYSIELGRVQIGLTRDRQRWPIELQRLSERLLKPEVKVSEKKSSAVFLFLPKRLSLRLDQLLWNDEGKPVLDLRETALSLNFKERRLAVRNAELVALDRIKEKFLEFELFGNMEREVNLNIRQRPDYKGKPLWSASCNFHKNPFGGRCDVDAERLPDIMLTFAQSKLGSVFAPGFRGGVGLESLDGVGLQKTKVSIRGVFENISVEHPSLSIGPVGPVNIRSSMDMDINLEQRSVSSAKSPVFVFLPQASQGRGIQFETEFSLSFLDRKQQDWLPRGNFQLNAERINCEDIMHTIPLSFMPELSGFEMTGTAALRTQINLDQNGAEFSIAGSKFNCDVTVAPEMYSASYLSGPFVIERETPGGKITIPVDPARPYFVGYKDIPVLVRSAFVASEDTGFFRHQGVEIGALVGAVEKNAEVKRAAVGGSTITMQTVKNLFLARDKTLSRKMQEIFLAWHLERTISKERILEIYLNMVEFGPGLYGIGRASQRFFGKDPRDISLKEAIYLASLLPAPIPRYQYFCRGSLTPAYNKILKQLLDRMLILGKITAKQHAEAISAKLEFSELEREAACGGGGASAPDNDFETDY